MMDSDEENERDYREVVSQIEPDVSKIKANYGLREPWEMELSDEDTDKDGAVEAWRMIAKKIPGLKPKVGTGPYLGGDGGAGGVDEVESNNMTSAQEWHKMSQEWRALCEAEPEPVPGAFPRSMAWWKKFEGDCKMFMPTCDDEEGWEIMRGEAAQLLEYADDGEEYDLDADLEVEDGLEEGKGGGGGGGAEFSFISRKPDLSNGNGAKFVCSIEAQSTGSLPWQPTGRDLQQQSPGRVIQLPYLDEWPTIIKQGSEVAPGLLRYLGTTTSGGWKNPAVHCNETRVSVVAAGKDIRHEIANGTTMTIAGDKCAGYDDVDGYVDDGYVDADDGEEGPAPKGLRQTQPSERASLEGILDWRTQPCCDYFSIWNTWFTIDIGRGRRMRPSHYAMRNGGSLFASPEAWWFEGANSRHGPWEILDARGFDKSGRGMNGDSCFSDLADAHMPSWPEHEKTRELVIPRWEYSEPKPHDGIVFKCRLTQEEDDAEPGYRFFRVLQLRSQTHDRHCLHIDAFELYGNYTYGVFEGTSEETVNPAELTASERSLQGGSKKLEVMKKVSWDAKQVLDRVRVNKKFSGKTYAEEVAESSMAIEKQFAESMRKIEEVERAKLQGATPDGEEEVDEGGDEDEDEEGQDEEAGAGAEGTIETQNLRMMDSSEILRVAWLRKGKGMGSFMTDLRNWIGVSMQDVSYEQLAHEWLLAAASANNQNAQVTCKIIDTLIKDKRMSVQDLASACSNPSLADVILSDSPHLTGLINNMLSSYGQAPIASEGGGMGQDEEEEAELLRELEMLKLGREGGGGGEGDEGQGEGGADGGEGPHGDDEADVSANDDAVSSVVSSDAPSSR